MHLRTLLILAAFGVPTSLQAQSSYDQLVTLFGEWRDFERPAFVDGVPDYSADAMGRQYRELGDWKERLWAFEIDSFNEEEAVSVIIRGTARKLEEDEEHRSENLPLRPWVDTIKYNVVEITPTAVSGRRYKLASPWLHMQ